MLAFQVDSIPFATKGECTARWQGVGHPEGDFLEKRFGMMGLVPMLDVHGKCCTANLIPVLDILVVVRESLQEFVAVALHRFDNGWASVVDKGGILG